MGSNIEINDTLQLTYEQGFPKKLSYETHIITPFKTTQFTHQIFSFKKPGIRLYQGFPVRNFLVEKRQGKWLYWGLVHILETTQDYKTEETSGTFIIVHINSLAEMKQAFQLIDRRQEYNFFTDTQ